MRFRLGPVLIVALSLLVVVAIATLLFISQHPTPSAVDALSKTSLRADPNTSNLKPSMAVNYESLGGCAEDALDRNHDIDPTGFVDQEDDECLPAQHRHRRANGAPAP